MTNFVFFFVIHFFINKICLKTNYLIDKKDTSDHKKKIITEDKTPLSGGLVFIIFFSLIIPHENYVLLVSIILLYSLGILSDINYLSSPSKRIILQSLLVLGFVLGSDLTIITLSIDALDRLLDFQVIKILFILSCFLVLINGFNFLDGINTLVLGNFLICLISIYYVSIEFDLSLNFMIIEKLLIILSIIFIFNFFGKSFLGDSGTYSISFLIGFICINFVYLNNTVVSPYFIASLLWYPAIENLFSIIRRYFSKTKLSKADNNHLHHYLYLGLKMTRISDNNLFLNTFTGMLINFYMILSAYISSINFSHTKTLLIILLFNISVYLIIYFLMNKKIIKQEKNIN